MKKIKLLPCPCCGGNATIIESQWGQKVACSKCEVCTAWELKSLLNKAIKAWNKRTVTK